jgi:drug/metabolite transporter (DMT)-like permease
MAVGRVTGDEGVGLNVGLGLALLCAIATQVGFLCKHRGAERAPRVDMRRPLRSARGLFGSTWFAAGMGLALVAWLLHVAAMALAPLSVVQVALSSGVVMLAVIGQRMFGCRVGSRQWVGVVMTAAGLGLLVLTLPESSGVGFALGGLVAFEAGMLAVGALLIAAPRLGAPAHHHGAVLGAAAGILFGVSDVAIKALTEASGPVAVLASPWLLTAAVASVLAFLASARAFQEGEAVPVIASTSTAANVTAIAGGILVFGDALAGGMLLVVQLAAFALVAIAALVTPSGHGRLAI